MVILCLKLLTKYQNYIIYYLEEIMALAMDLWQINNDQIELTKKTALNYEKRLKNGFLMILHYWDLIY